MYDQYLTLPEPVREFLLDYAQQVAEILRTHEVQSRYDDALLTQSVYDRMPIASLPEPYRAYYLRHREISREKTESLRGKDYAAGEAIYQRLGEREKALQQQYPSLAAPLQAYNYLFRLCRYWTAQQMLAELERSDGARLDETQVMLWEVELYEKNFNRLFRSEQSGLPAELGSMQLNLDELVAETKLAYSKMGTQFKRMISTQGQRDRATFDALTPAQREFLQGRYQLKRQLAGEVKDLAELTWAQQLEMLGRVEKTLPAGVFPEEFERFWSQYLALIEQHRVQSAGVKEQRAVKLTQARFARELYELARDVPLAGFVISRADHHVRSLPR